MVAQLQSHSGVSRAFRRLVNVTSDRGTRTEGHRLIARQERAVTKLPSAQHGLLTWLFYGLLMFFRCQVMVVYE